MDKRPHVAVTGSRGAGKTYIIRRLIESLFAPVYGYMTKSLAADETGFHSIYIHKASTPVANREYTAENLIGTCNQIIHNINTKAFELGAEYINSAKPGGFIIMDELGFMEAGSDVFTASVLNALDGDIPVIASIKKDCMPVEFLDKVRSHPRLRVYEVTRENSDDVFEEIKNYLDI